MVSRCFLLIGGWFRYYILCFDFLIFRVVLVSGSLVGLGSGMFGICFSWFLVLGLCFRVCFSCVICLVVIRKVKF